MFTGRHPVHHPSQSSANKLWSETGTIFCQALNISRDGDTQPAQRSTPTRKKNVFLYTCSNFPRWNLWQFASHPPAVQGPAEFGSHFHYSHPLGSWQQQLIKHSSPLIAWTHSKLSVSFVSRMQDSSCSPSSTEKRGTNHIPQSRPGCNLLAGWATQCAIQQDPHHLCCTDTLDYQPLAHTVAWSHTTLNGRFYIYCCQGVAMSSSWLRCPCMAVLTSSVKTTPRCCTLRLRAFLSQHAARCQDWDKCPKLWMLEVRPTTLFLLASYVPSTHSNCGPAPPPKKKGRGDFCTTMLLFSQEMLDGAFS